MDITNIKLNISFSFVVSICKYCDTIYVKVLYTSGKNSVKIRVFQKGFGRFSYDTYRSTDPDPVQHQLGLHYRRIGIIPFWNPIYG